MKKMSQICTERTIIFQTSVATVVTDAFRKKMDIACEIKSLELPKYLRSWNTPKTEGLYFGPKRMGHSLSQYVIGYDS